MAKSRNTDGDYMISETGNWNVADSCSKIKIMRLLGMADIYEDVALYGFDSFMEELMYYNIPVEELRIRGLRRLIDTLIKLARNARFAMKREGTKDELKKFETVLEKARDEALPLVHKKIINHVEGTSATKIDETKFSNLLKAISQIKSEMNDPLNKNHLIFTDREEFDPKAFKDKIKERMVERG